jgi:steroid 5-alpha reductase family enzyme
VSARTRSSMVGIVASVAMATFIGWAGSQGGISTAGWPVFALCAVTAFALNWMAFLPAYVFSTERYYDLVGSLTYCGTVIAAFALGQNFTLRALLLGGLVLIWSLRLGSFLFARIRADGRDRRFDSIKTDPLAFLMTWTLQALWALVTVGPALSVITTAPPTPLGLPAALGISLWTLGFTIEAVADRQKQAFRADAANRQRFIDIGLWGWSRHPNYFGEITLWLGVALIAAPALSGWQLVTMISPIFVFVLLWKVSGIPLLEKRADERWGGSPSYERYKAETPVLFPRLSPTAILKRGILSRKEST